MATPKRPPLDAAREHLRAAGYDDGEISQMLRAEAGPAATSSAPVPGTPGMMSGVLGNASAAMSFARGTVPFVQDNYGKVSDRRNAARVRVKSAVVLALATFVVVVICFAIFQEWQRHVIYETTMAKEQAAVAHTKSCDERSQSAIITLADVESPAVKQYKADCADFFPPDSTPKIFSNRKDKIDDLSSDVVLAEFSNIDARFHELTHYDGSQVVKLCVYREALRGMNEGFDQVDAVRMVAIRKQCLPDPPLNAAKP